MFLGYTTDQLALSLCIWREARGEGQQGMLAVACVVRNRVHKHNSGYALEVYRKWQFSSITASGDPQLHLFPTISDPTWAQAQKIAADVISGQAEDITNGSTLYYDDSIPFPKNWNRSKCKFACTIGRLHFYIELN